jgi:tetratricopeptide (TPR) repeat protein
MVTTITGIDKPNAWRVSMMGLSSFLIELISKVNQQLNPVMPYRTLALNVYDKQSKYEIAFQILKKGHEKIKEYDIGLLYYIGMYSLKRDFHIQEGINAFEEVLTKRENSGISVFFRKIW